MSPDEAKRRILDALADLPSGPPGEEVLAVLMAQAWDEGWNDGAGWPQQDLNPYRSVGAGA